MFIVLVGLNHRTAPVEVRERLALSESAQQQTIHDLRNTPGIEGCIILSTCNRFEIYCAVRELEPGIKAVNQFLANWLTSAGISLEEVKKHFYCPTCHEAVGHLFRVAAGLDSMVIGESQILGQVREAYELALAQGVTNGVLNTLFQQAISVGKRVRTETAIDRHAVSISYAAVELARQILGQLERHTVLVIGAGETAELTARHLVANGISSVLVSNRSYDRAVELARQFKGSAKRFEHLEETLVDADIVISCTAACHYVLHAEAVQRAMQVRSERPLLIIDIAVPRDVEPTVNDLDGVHLFDIDDLQNVVDANFQERQLEAIKAERIVQDELMEFNNWLNTLFVVPTIVALKEKAEKIKKAELTRAFNRLGTVSAREEKVIKSMANSIVNQLLHDPIIQLKASASSSQGHQITEIVQNLFSLDLEREDFPYQGEAAVTAESK
ncbi:MAG: glutamyl-tRNA reductase [Syntrophomonadaceae bacterium]|nr:glutamyl-tRNA reductase [Syntrophomonadaceae bacterium]